MTKIKELKLEMLNCPYEDCTLKAHCLKPLIGSGPEDADVMVVGEAPGVFEIREGKPFVGKSGKKLNEILNKAGLARKNIYLTNSVRCKLPEGYKPKKDVLDLCKSWLLREIEIVDPKMIVLLGSTAAQVAGLSSKVSASRGKVQMLEAFGEERKCLVTYHPAYLLRNPNHDFVVIEDFKRVKRESKQRNPLPPKQRQYKLLRTKAEILNYLKSLDKTLPIAVDLETVGLHPMKEMKHLKSIIGIAMTQHTHEGVFILLEDFSIGDAVFKALKEFFLDASFEKILHNAKFDRNWIKRIFDVEMQGIIYDTMIAHSLIREDSPSHSLKALAILYTDLGSYSDELKTAVDEYGGWDKVPVEIMTEYAATDVDATLRLYQKFKTHWTDDLDVLMLALMIPSVHSLGDIELNGFAVDTEYLSKLTIKYENDKNKLHEEILTLPDVSEFIAKEKIKFNIQSPAQIAVYLYGWCDLIPLELTPSGKPSVAEGVLKLHLKESLAPEDKEFLTLLMKYRKLKKLESTYISGMAKHIYPDERVRTEFHLARAVTGRLASSRPNMQNISTNKEIKNIFIASKGNIIIQADFKQLELRVGAEYAQDKAFFKIFREGKDAHRVLGAVVFAKAPEDITKEERVLAKTVNFGIFYGLPAEQVAEKAEVPLEQAYYAYEQFFIQHPHVKQWIYATQRFCKQTGYVKSMLGRVRHLPQINSLNRGEQKHALNQCVNFPIQSLASDVTLTAMNAVMDQLKYKKLDALLIGEVHDSIILDCPYGIAEEVIPIVKNTMEGNRFGFEVPLEVDIEIGESWGDLEVVEL